jgi:hypothetical protein
LTELGSCYSEMQRQLLAPQKIDKKRKIVEVDVDVALVLDVEVDVEVGVAIESAAGNVDVNAEVGRDDDVPGDDNSSECIRHPQTNRFRCITMAVVGKYGQIRYSYDNQAQEGTPYDRFSGIFCLTFTVGESYYGSLTDMTWVDMERGTRLTFIRYFQRVVKYYVDVVNRRMACSWKCEERYCIDVWNLESNEVIAVFDKFHGSPKGIAICICDDRLLVGTPACFSVWEIKTQTPVFVNRLTTPMTTSPSDVEVQEPRPIYNNACYAYPLDDISRIVVIVDDHLKVFDGSDGRELLMTTIQWKNPLEKAVTIVSSADKSLYGFWSDETIYIYDSVSLSKLSDFSFYEHDSFPVGFGPSDEFIFAVMRGLLFWNFRTGMLKKVSVKSDGRSVNLYDIVAYNPYTNIIVAVDEKSERGYAVEATSLSGSVTVGRGRPFPSDARKIYYCPAPEVVLM